jgi:ABC-type transporter Mla subunit MlaD
MAINKQEKTVAIAQDLQLSAEQLMDVLEKFPKILAQINSSGIDFTEFTDHFAQLKWSSHLVGGDFNSVVSGFNNLIAWFDEKDAQGNSLYRRDPFNKLRTGA